MCVGLFLTMVIRQAVGLRFCAEGIWTFSLVRIFGRQDSTSSTGQAMVWVAISMSMKVQLASAEATKFNGKLDIASQTSQATTTMASLESGSRM